MLTKLIKHEWNSVCKVLLIINSFTVIMTVIGCFSFFTPIWQTDLDYLGVLAVSALLLYYLTIIAVSFSSIIYLAVRFYRNLFTDEGYLMHTLPVTPRQLLLSKGIVATIWVMITGILIVISVIVLLFSLGHNIDPDFTLRYFLDQFGPFNTMIEEMFGMNLTGFVIYMCIACIIGSISSICMIYGAICIGQLFSRHKLMGSILSYVGIYMVIQTITSLLITPYTTRMIFETDSSQMADFMNPTLWFSLILSTVAGVTLYFISEYIMKKKLNLD